MSQTELLTIGYEGSSFAEFLATLKRARVDVVIDIQTSHGFSKTALSSGLADSHIEYIHLRGLGDPKSGRVAARQGRHDDFRKIFNAHLLSPSAQRDIHRGVEAAAGRKACLLCFERDHLQCHRQIVADEFTRRGGFRLKHIVVSEGLGLQTRLRGSRRHHESFVCNVG